MTDKPELLPLFFRAESVVFRAAKDRHGFLLDIRSTDNQEIAIAFPASYAQEFLEQVQNLADHFPKVPGHTPNNKTEH